MEELKILRNSWNLQFVENMKGLFEKEFSDRIMEIIEVKDVCYKMKDSHWHWPEDHIKELDKKISIKDDPINDRFEILDIR